MRFSLRTAAPVAALVSLFSVCAVQAQNAVTGITFLGKARFNARSLQVGGTTVGGLSGIAYNRAEQEYYILSDDAGNLGLGSPRFYTTTLDVGVNNAPNSFDITDVNFTDVTPFTQGGNPFPAPVAGVQQGVDLEGIALSADGNTLYVTDEGYADRNVNPVVRTFNRATGEQIGTLAAPSYYNSASNTAPGVRFNAAFESATLDNNGNLLIGAEGPLRQEGATGNVAGAGNSFYNFENPVRLLQYNNSGSLTGEFVYVTDPLVTPITTAGQFGISGLVELLHVTGDSYLALERSFTITGNPSVTGYDIKLYEFNLNSGTNILGNPNASDLDTFAFNAVEKRLVLDFATLGIPLDNIEGMTFGPSFGNQRTLIIVGDDNFSTGNGNGPGTPAQFNQILAFSVIVAPEPATLTLLLPLVVGVLVRRKK